MVWKAIARMTAAPMLALAVASSPAFAAPPKPADASIPFVDMGSIGYWQADRDKGLFVQDQHRKWYYAALMGFTRTIGFETRGIDTLDKFAAVVVRGQRCPFASFVASSAPPSRAKKAHGG